MADFIFLKQNFFSMRLFREILQTKIPRNSTKTAKRSLNWKSQQSKRDTPEGKKERDDSHSTCLTAPLYGKKTVLLWILTKIVSCSHVLCSRGWDHQPEIKRITRVLHILCKIIHVVTTRNKYWLLGGHRSSLQVHYHGEYITKILKGL